MISTAPHAAAMVTGCVDAGLPGQLGRSAAQGGDRVGEAGPVHVDAQTCVLRDAGQIADFVGGVEGAGFGGLGDAEHGGLHAVHVADLPHRGRAQLGGVDPGVVAGQRNELGPACEELRCAAFVGVDVTVAVAQHAAPGRGEGGQAQGVGRGPGGDGQYIDVAFEDLREARAGAGGEPVGAVGQILTGGRSGDGLDDLGRGAGGVDAGEYPAGARRGRRCSCSGTSFS